MYFQLFENYHVFKKPELKKSVEKTPLASDIDWKLDAESKVGGNDRWTLSSHIVECLSKQLLKQLGTFTVRNSTMYTVLFNTVAQVNRKSVF